jgi:hypothetical protein
MVSGDAKDSAIENNYSMGDIGHCRIHWHDESFEMYFLRKEPRIGHEQRCCLGNFCYSSCYLSSLSRLCGKSNSNFLTGKQQITLRESFSEHREQLKRSI